MLPLIMLCWCRYEHEWTTNTSQDKSRADNSRRTSDERQANTQQRQCACHLSPAALYTQQQEAKNTQQGNAPSYSLLPVFQVI